MATRRTQYNVGPGILDIINFVPGAYFEMQVTLDHDITNSTFEAEVLDPFKAVIGTFTISGVTPLASGVFALSMPEAETALITAKSSWYLDEIIDGKRTSILAGDLEVYTK